MIKITLIFYIVVAMALAIFVMVDALKDHKYRNGYYFVFAYLMAIAIQV